MKKHSIARAVIVSLIFTCLYAFFLLAETGPGFENSFVAKLDFRSLLVLAFYAFLFCAFFCSAVLFVCLLLSYFIDKDGLLDAIGEDVAICCIAVTIVAYLSVAFGFVSMGGF